MESSLIYVASLCLVCLVYYGQPASARLTEACEKFKECNWDAQEAFEECQKLLGEIDQDEVVDFQQARSGRSMECSKFAEDTRDILALKREAHKDKILAFNQCLDDNSDDSVEHSQLKGRMADRCDAALEDFERRSTRVKRSITRQVRQAGFFGGRRGRRGGQGDRGGRRGRGGRGNGPMSKVREFRQCQRRANQLRKSCKPLTKCCSEAGYCHLEYELSPLHNTIKGLQQDIVKGRMACRKEMQRQQSRNNNNNNRGRFAADDWSPFDNFDVVPDYQIVNAD